MTGPRLLSRYTAGRHVEDGQKADRQTELGFTGPGTRITGPKLGSPVLELGDDSDWVQTGSLFSFLKEIKFSAVYSSK